MKLRIVIVAALGLALGLYLVMYVGLGAVFSAAVAVGWSGFAILCLYALGLFVVLGAAWHVLLPDSSRAGLWVFVRARMVRDSAAEVLPFSQLGGIVLGARAAILQGVASPLVPSGTVGFRSGAHGSGFGRRGAAVFAAWRNRARRACGDPAGRCVAPRPERGCGFSFGRAWFGIRPPRCCRFRSLAESCSARVRRSCRALRRPSPRAGLWVFVRARMVRDSAAEVLPFSQLGGIVLGARAAILQGVASPLALASTIVDVTTEMLA